MFGNKNTKFLQKLVFISYKKKITLKYRHQYYIKYFCLSDSSYKHQAFLNQKYYSQKLSQRNSSVRVII